MSGQPALKSGGVTGAGGGATSLRTAGAGAAIFGCWTTAAIRIGDSIGSATTGLGLTSGCLTCSGGIGAGGAGFGTARSGSSVNSTTNGVGCALPMGMTSNVTSAYRSARRAEEHKPELQSIMRHTYGVLCLTKKREKNE